MSGETGREITCKYADPIDVIWVRTAERLGMCVVRVPEVFASWDGRGCLSVGTGETLDADDSLAQMIFHEICHALVEGPRGFELPDWGLDIDRPEDLIREQASLRLQAALADRFGLRQFLAATTDFRSYYDELPAAPLQPLGDPAVELARAGWQRATAGPWAEAIQDALEATAAIARIVAPFAPLESLWRRVEVCRDSTVRIDCSDFSGEMAASRNTLGG